MTIQIEQAILDKSTKCQAGHRCLTEGTCPGCEIKPFGNGDRFLVIPKTKGSTCSYLTAFGFASHVCRCPTRLEIYRKYGK